MGNNKVQPWMRGFLLIGSVYNIAWAIFLFYLPGSYIKWITEGAQQINKWVTYQAIGVAIIGVFMLMAALYPLKYRFLLIVALLGKSLGGLIVYLLIMDSVVTKKFIFHLLMNDLIWAVPLIFITAAAFKSQNDR
ncbi:hypothetical protein GCM10011506_43010 [Marivirga lumbricoides]|uniref:Alkyl hydroperoxide reductase n=1 Tax=Marivirga lumbricoides TaxID=1046115 RepID=A0ABQ1N6Y7_9BACT|nr:hypothetical protein GCM10011506_43010 [Marivirga lumbricoides]